MLHVHVPFRQGVEVGKDDDALAEQSKRRVQAGEGRRAPDCMISTPAAASAMRNRREKAPTMISSLSPTTSTNRLCEQGGAVAAPEVGQALRYRSLDLIGRLVSPVRRSAGVLGLRDDPFTLAEMGTI